MRLKRLLANDFRNLEYCNIDPQDCINVICGPNGSGKTSVLEAISYLALGRSFRPSCNYQSLIKRGLNAFELFAKVEEAEGQPAVAIGFKKDRTGLAQIKLNQDKSVRLLDVISYLCVQVIHPQGSELVTGSPDERRSYLDWGLFYHYPRFKEAHYAFKKLLSQRNSLLRRHSNSYDFAFWDEQLAAAAEVITKLRFEYLQNLRPILKDKLELFLPDLKFEFELSPGFDEEAGLKAMLEQNLERDLNLGYTFSGPHRCDLKIKTSKISASQILSRGQLKLLTAAMRLSQGQLLFDEQKRSCIYLIDDLNSELDERSQEILISSLKALNHQIFITNITPDLKVLNDLGNVALFEVNEGKVTKKA